MKKIVSTLALVAISCSVTACAPRNDTARNRADMTPNTVDDRGYHGTAPGVDPTGINNMTGDARNRGNIAGDPIMGTPQGPADPNQAYFGQGVGRRIDQGVAPGTDRRMGQGMGQAAGQGAGQGVNQGAGAGTGIGTQYGAQGAGYGTAAGAMFRDGTFEGEGNHNGRATVTVRNGRITNIVLRRIAANGTLVDDDNLNAGQNRTGGATANIGQSKSDIVNAMLRAQSPEVVTSTTGDTQLVDDWKLAVRRALDRARR
jgi:major membrane immunogen (membrane-anchored lipoprotein)